MAANRTAILALITLMMLMLTSPTEAISIGKYLKSRVSRVLETQSGRPLDVFWWFDTEVDTGDTRPHERQDNAGRIDGEDNNHKMRITVNNDRQTEEGRKKNDKKTTLKSLLSKITSGIKTVSNIFAIKSAKDEKDDDDDDNNNHNDNDDKIKDKKKAANKTKKTGALTSVSDVTVGGATKIVTNALSYNSLNSLRKAVVNAFFKAKEENKDDKRDAKKDDDSREKDSNSQTTGGLIRDYTMGGATRIVSDALTNDFLGMRATVQKLSKDAMQQAGKRLIDFAKNIKGKIADNLYDKLKDIVQKVWYKKREALYDGFKRLKEKAKEKLGDIVDSFKEKKYQLFQYVNDSYNDTTTTQSPSSSSSTTTATNNNSGNDDCNSGKAKKAVGTNVSGGSVSEPGNSNDRWGVGEPLWLTYTVYTGPVCSNVWLYRAVLHIHMPIKWR